MTPSSLRRCAHLLLAVALLLTCWSGPALADPAPAPGKVRGSILTRGVTPKVDVLYFADDWTYLGRVKALGGGYSLTLEPGSYHLQVVDRAPSYEVDKYAPSDVAVVVTSAATTVKNVRMRRGNAIGGTVRAGGVPAKGARVVAANIYEQSFETTADARGNYALGGLPEGRYSVFTYDRKRAWVARSSFVGKLKKGVFRKLSPTLDKRAGSLIVDLYAGSEQATTSAYLTAVSLKTGQFWTVRSSGGTATFRGLYPGSYKIVAPAYGAYAALTAPVSDGVVRAGKAAFGSFRWTVAAPS